MDRPNVIYVGKDAGTPLLAPLTCEDQWAVNEAADMVAAQGSDSGRYLCDMKQWHSPNKHQT